MRKRIKVKSGSYYDSVTLMSISREVSQLEGIEEATLVMATDSNLEILRDSGFESEKIEDSGPNDLIVAIKGQENQLPEAFTRVEDHLTRKKKSSETDKGKKPHSIEGALDYNPEANLVLISVPGEFAAREARKALEENLHVMLFSGNVSIEDEIELKEMAAERNLLMMGPDCGTAIINQKPLAFANVVESGPIGIVSASGTGAQEVSTLIQRAGVGLSQVIGTGGRDLSHRVGGLEMIKDLKALAADDSTEIIVLISKPPASQVAAKIMQVIEKIHKPVVINFLGEQAKVGDGQEVYRAETLQEAAFTAVNLVKEEEISPELDSNEIEQFVEQEKQRLKTGQKYIRGLYTGGTLCSEALILLQRRIGEIYSNIPLEDRYGLGEDLLSRQNTLLDLGEDEFTKTNPHPMIDPGLRNERLRQEIEDKETGIILADIVLGYGSHSDPAGEFAGAVKEARNRLKSENRGLSVIVSICGTEGDPQDYQQQKEKLENADIKVADTNVQAVKLAAELFAGLQEG